LFVNIVIIIYKLPCLQAAQLGIELSVVFSDNSNTPSTDWNKLMVSADPKKISQVFRNIISNALKFTPRTGTVIVRISKATDNHRFGSGSIKIDIEDSGVGISLVGCCYCSFYINLRNLYYSNTFNTITLTRPKPPTYIYI